MGHFIADRSFEYAGDCLLVSKLIYQVVLELKKNPESAPDYQRLLIELEALDRALKQLHYLSRLEQLCRAGRLWRRWVGGCVYE